MSASGSTTGLLPQDQLLKQRYRILAQVGKGGFAAVYKAEDLHFYRRLVAVKEMSQSGLRSRERAEAVEAFTHEAQLLAGLQHPHLPRIYDHFSEGGRWYLVMDFLEGETLENFLLHQPSARLSLKETLDIGLQLCAVLDYLHTRQPPIIFRDLKPANILYASSKQLYLIDFGIARHFKPGQIKDTMPLGSPGYAAPEQYGRAQTAPQSDIYSMGVILHHLLSGEDPSEQPFFLAPLRLVGPEALRDLETLIEHMTHMDPKQRPASADEVQGHLQAIAARLSENRRRVPPRAVAHDERYGSERAGQRERSGARQEQVQEQVLYSPENRSRRRFLLGGLLAGTALAVGAGSLLALFSTSRGQKVRPTPTAQPVHSKMPVTIVHPGPDVMFGFDAQHTRFNTAEHLLSPANVPQLTLAWVSPFLGENVFSSPTVSGGLVYVGSLDGRVHAFDVATGKLRWLTEQHGAASTSNDSTPAVVNGVVYICLQDERLYALDALTGQLRWASPAEYALGSSPTVANGVVYVSGNEQLYAFDAASGRTRWISSPGDGSTTHTSPAVANGVVYLAMAGNGPYTGRVYAFDAATGKLRWASELTDGGTDPNSSPAVAHGLVYIGSGRGGLMAFDAEIGKLRWITAATKGSTGSSPAVADGLVYLAQDPIYAFDALSGELRWVSESVGAYNDDSPLVANGVIYVCSSGHYTLYALDATSGRVLWTSPATGDQTFTMPAVADGVVYVSAGNRNVQVYAFHLPRR